jgi:hypothetical protein
MPCKCNAQERKSVASNDVHPTEGEGALPYKVSLELRFPNAKMSNAKFVKSLVVMMISENFATRELLSETLFSEEIHEEYRSCCCCDGDEFRRLIGMDR